MKLYNYLFILLLSLLTATTAHGQLVAGFTASPTTGCAPLLVTFTNTTSPSAGTSYSWAFGTSGSSVLTDPSTSFTTPGTHLVTLTATNGTQVSTFTVIITVYPPPTVSFTASDTTVCPGTAITFNSTSTGGVPGPMTYTWSFGDGSPTATGASPVHTYSSPGNYTVTLLVSNSTGCTATLVKSMYIHVYDRPVASFVWTPTGICNPPGTITFTDGSSGPGPMTCAWTYGDGGTGTGTPASHSYGTVGTYNVTLIVTDANGCLDTAVLGPIHVDNIHAEFTFPESACVFTPVTFPDASTAHTSQTWSYGDGSPNTTGVNGSHTYLTPGTYTVTLVISNPPCTQTVTHTITINPQPTVDFVMSPVIPCPAPVAVTHTATGPTGATYTWTFTGGGSATGNPAINNYGSNGVKTVTMVCTDPATGCRDTLKKTDTIYDIDYQAFANPYHGCVPLTVNFSSTAYTHVPPPGMSVYPLPLTTYTWNYGDGSAPSTSATPTHTYTAIGVYVATVTATTANGCPVTDTVVIEVGAPPSVTFTASPRHICYGSHTPVIFDITVVTGPVDEYHWSWGDNDEVVYDTSASDASHFYTVPGTFTVSVIPYYRGCPGVPYTIANYIIVDSSKSIMLDTIKCSPPTAVSFHNASLGDDSHMWIFGDGFTSTLDDVVHTYPALGPYTVTLTTWNAATGCRDTLVQNIDLIHPLPNFAATDTAICKDEAIDITSWITGGSATNYWWYINSVYTSTLAPTFTHTFTATGNYTIKLIIKNINGCFDTVTKSNYIFVSKPTPSFTGSPVSGCRPLNVLFTDASTAVPGSSIISRTWNFGDGFTGAGTPVSHTYVTAGSYDVKEVLTDNIGCKDSLIRPAYINVYQPVAAFYASNTHPCLNIPVGFTCTSGSVATAVWDFGDGSATATGMTPTHTYSALGTYNVKLTITDTHGCTDMVTYPAYITVTKPVANFTMSDSVSVCPPLFVNFTNTTTGAVSYLWDLGDATTTTAPSPSDMYIVAGLYHVQMIATNVYGCTDTMKKDVNIFGYAGAFTYAPLQGCAPFAVHFTASLSNVPFIIWDFSDGTTSSATFSDTITHVYLTPGAYVPKLLLTDNTGCQNSSVGVDTIKVDAVTAKFTSTPNPVCIGVPFNFIDSSTTYFSPITSWNWTYDGNTSTLPSPSYTIATPGTYPVTLNVVNGWGCTGSITKDVVVLPPPVISVSPDTVVCVGDAATLFGYGAVTYTWDPPATLSCTNCNPTMATPAVVTTYTVVGADANGCKDTASVTVGLRTNTISHAWGDTSVCPGYPVHLFDTGGTSYTWFPGTGLNSSTIFNPIAMPSVTTQYMVVARLGSCIPDTNYVTVGIYAAPTVDAGPDQRLLAGSTAQLNATGTRIQTYVWSPDETLSCNDCANPVASMSLTTTYYVEVATTHGCKASDSVRILLYCDNSQVFIPNSFTPNGDGQNDVFYPRGVGVKIIKSFRIYNRWGELLFEKNGIGLNDAVNGWDGSYKGSTPKPDVYVYIMDAVCYTGEDIIVKGDVNVIR